MKVTIKLGLPDDGEGNRLLEIIWYVVRAICLQNCISVSMTRE